MKTNTLFIAAILVSLVLTTQTAAAPLRSTDTLQVTALFQLTPSPVACPAGTPATTGCLQVSSNIVPIRGLGQVTESYEILLDTADPQCVHASWLSSIVTVANKGQINLQRQDPYPCDPPQTAPAMGPVTVTGGTGTYAGASGSGQILNSNQTENWTTTLTVSGLTFDLTPPKITGTKPKTVLVGKGVTSARVNFRVTALDAVDGTIGVKCTPRPGSRFKIGRTKVNCTATDSSANTATKTFTITVKRR